MGLKINRGVASTGVGTDENLANQLEDLIFNSIVLKSTPATDVATPEVGSIAIFINATTGKFAFKKSDGSIVELGGAII